MDDRPAPEEPAQAEHEAIGWVVKVNDPHFDEWETFENWLAAAPENADAYQAATIAEAAAVTVLATALPAVRTMTVTRLSAARRYTAWACLALAASLVGIVGYRTMSPPAPLVYETAAGSHRTITLADGSSVLLNGGTRLLVDGSNARALTLERGEALIDVRHNAARPFSVVVGAARVVDIGTRFDLTRDGDETRLAVSEGIVDWNREDGSVRVPAGRALRARDGSSDVELLKVATETIGGWSQGQLSYDGQPLEEVATDIARSTGARITVDRTVGRQAVRGVVRLDGGADATVPRLAALMGLRASHTDGTWNLAP